MGKIILIRHGATEGNLKKRYIGRTDEPLSEAAVQALRQNTYPDADEILISPMLRCRQTAEIVYPGRQYTVCPEMREIDFGRFEGKTYLELNGDPDYQAWIDSGGTLPFPDGEDSAAFRDRCARAFAEVLSAPQRAGKTLAFVVHGGTIMAVLERFSQPESSFYDWQLANGEGYICTYCEGKLYEVRKLSLQKENDGC